MSETSENPKADLLIADVEARHNDQALSDGANENQRSNCDGCGSERRHWRPITDDAPALGEICWLWDGQRIWVGGRDRVDSEYWLWGNCYHRFWYNAVKWDADLETDDDYKPTHWMPLP